MNNKVNSRPEDVRLFEVVKLLAAQTLFGPNIIKTDSGEPESSGPEGIYKASIAKLQQNIERAGKTMRQFA